MYNSLLEFKKNYCDLSPRTFITHLVIVVSQNYITSSIFYAILHCKPEVSQTVLTRYNMANSDSLKLKIKVLEWLT